MLKVYIGEELVVEGGEKGLDIGFVEAGVFEDDDGFAVEKAHGEVLMMRLFKLVIAARVGHLRGQAVKK